MIPVVEPEAIASLFRQPDFCDMLSARLEKTLTAALISAGILPSEAKRYVESHDFGLQIMAKHEGIIH